jgi:putative membrane protein
MIKLSQADHKRIADAVGAAEDKTSGEIFCVLARKVGDYREASFAWAAIVALIVPLALIPFGLTADRLPFIGDGWRAGQASAVDSVATASLISYATAQAILFVLALLVFSIPAVRRAITPRAVKRQRVRRAALEQFFSKALHLSDNRTGVLIFASDAERMVEIVADEDIHELAGEKDWEGAAALLTKGIGDGRAADGFIDAVGHVGHVLATHFPAKGPNPNQLPNHLIEI